jgi:hypothetical protein
MELGEKGLNLAWKNVGKEIHIIKDVKSFCIGLSNMGPWSIVVIGVNLCVLLYILVGNINLGK